LTRASEEGVTDVIVCEELGISARQRRRLHIGVVPFFAVPTSKSTPNFISELYIQRKRGPEPLVPNQSVV